MKKYWITLLIMMGLFSCEGSKQNPQAPTAEKASLYRLGKVDRDSTITYHPLYIQK